MHIFYLIITFIPLVILYPTIVKGRKNFIKGKCIFTCNHRSNFDGILVYHKFGRRIRFLAKKELFKNKLLSSFLKSIGTISIDRGAVDINATKEALKTLKDNKPIGIFPQGTRSQSEDMEIKNGICMFAIKAKSPIVPIYIEKKPRIFRLNRMFIGEPFELTEFYDKKLTKEVLDEAAVIVLDKFEELKNKYEKKKEVK